MNTYKLRYIYGQQEKLSSGKEELVQATSVNEALRPKSSWPIQLNMQKTCGWAINPGNSLYFIEAWEAELQ